MQWFSELDVDGNGRGWQVDRERSGAIGPNAVGVEWTWRGVHDDVNRVGAFNGVAASGREVLVHGFTLMGVEEGGFRLRRYIDWAGLWAQLGLTLNWRTPVSPEPPG